MKKRVVFRGKFFTIKQWLQPLPGGKRELFEQAERPGSVMVFPVDAQGKVILLRERRFGTRKFIWHTVTGRVDQERSPLRAAKRELAEEAHLQASRWTKVWAQTKASGIVRWRQTVYLAQQLSPAKRDADPLEKTRPVRLSLRRAYELAIKGHVHYPDVAFHLIRLWHNRKTWLR